MAASGPYRSLDFECDLLVNKGVIEAPFARGMEPELRDGDRQAVLLAYLKEDRGVHGWVAGR